MALDSYSNLKDEIARNIARSDVTAFTPSVDTFIDQAEAYINLKLRCLQMQDSATVVTVGDTATANLPTDFLEAVSLTNRSDPRRVDFISLAAIASIGSYGQVGSPTRWTIVRDNDNSRYQAKFSPTPDGVYTLDLIYYARIAALSDSTTSTWLLAEYPDIYLNGALYFAFRRYRNPIASDYKAMLDMDIATLTEADEKRFTGGSGLAPSIMGTIV